MAAGDRLEAWLISGRAGHGRVQDRHRRVLTGQTRCDTGEQHRKWVPDAATIDGRQRARGDRAPCGLFDEVTTGERHGDGGDTHPGRHLGVAGLERGSAPASNAAGSRTFPATMWINASVHAASASCSVPSPLARAAIEDLAGLRPVTGDELGPRRLEEPLGRPSRIGGELRGARHKYTAAADEPPRCRARSAEASKARATRSSGPAAAAPRCHARRSASASASSASASAVWARRRSDAVAE